MVYPQEVVNNNGTRIEIIDGDFYGRWKGEKLQLQFVEPEDGSERYINLDKDQVGDLVDALMNWLNQEDK